MSSTLKQEVPMSSSSSSSSTTSLCSACGDEVAQELRFRKQSLLVGGMWAQYDADDRMQPCFMVGEGGLAVYWHKIYWIGVDATTDLETGYTSLEYDPNHKTAVPGDFVCAEGAAFSDSGNVPQDYYLVIWASWEGDEVALPYFYRLDVSMATYHQLNLPCLWRDTQSCLDTLQPSFHKDCGLCCLNKDGTLPTICNELFSHSSDCWDKFQTCATPQENVATMTVPNCDSSNPFFKLRDIPAGTTFFGQWYGDSIHTNYCYRLTFHGDWTVTLDRMQLGVNNDFCPTSLDDMQATDFDFVPDYSKTISWPIGATTDMALEFLNDSCNSAPPLATTVGIHFDPYLSFPYVDIWEDSSCLTWMTVHTGCTVTTTTQMDLDDVDDVDDVDDPPVSLPTFHGDVPCHTYFGASSNSYFGYTIHEPNRYPEPMICSYAEEALGPPDLQPNSCCSTLGTYSYEGFLPSYGEAYTTGLCAAHADYMQTILCSPHQGKYVRPLSTTVPTTTEGVLRICRHTCDQLFDACGAPGLNFPSWADYTDGTSLCYDMWGGFSSDCSYYVNNDLETTPFHCRIQIHVVEDDCLDFISQPSQELIDYFNQFNQYYSGDYIDKPGPCSNMASSTTARGAAIFGIVLAVLFGLVCLCGCCAFACLGLFTFLQKSQQPEKIHERPQQSHHDENHAANHETTNNNNNCPTYKVSSTLAESNLPPPIVPAALKVTTPSAPVEMIDASTKDSVQVITPDQVMLLQPHQQQQPSSAVRPVDKNNSATMEETTSNLLDFERIMALRELEGSRLLGVLSDKDYEEKKAKLFPPK